MKKIILLFTVIIFWVNVFSQAPAIPYGTARNNIESERDGSGFLGQIFNQSICGLNYVQASRKITTRHPNPIGSGLPVVLSIGGIPASAVIVNAYAWWVVSYQNGSSISPVIHITNPDAQLFSDTASLIGTGPYKCWGEIGSRAFRTDVTAAISGNGNYTCNITGNTVWEIDGITLMVVYKDTLASYLGTLVINDGLVIPWANQTLYLAGLNVCEVPIEARGFIIASDFQNNTGPNHTIEVNGVPNIFMNDFWNFDTVSAFLTLGQDSSQFGIIPATNDCYAWEVMGMYYRTQNCVTCPMLTSVSDLTDKEIITIDIFPNPATNAFTIYDERFTIEKIEMYSSLGEKVFERHLSSDAGHPTISIADFTPGIYFITVTNQAGNTVTRKVVKM